MDFDFNEGFFLLQKLEKAQCWKLQQLWVLYVDQEPLLVGLALVGKLNFKAVNNLIKNYSNSGKYSLGWC